MEDSESSPASMAEVPNPKPKTDAELEPCFRQDSNSIALLSFLYVLQGIPLGISGAIPMILQNRGVTYKQQVSFSFLFVSETRKLILPGRVQLRLLAIQPQTTVGPDRGFPVLRKHGKTKVLASSYPVLHRQVCVLSCQSFTFHRIIYVDSVLIHGHLTPDRGPGECRSFDCRFFLAKLPGRHSGHRR